MSSFDEWEECGAGEMGRGLHWQDEAKQQRQDEAKDECGRSGERLRSKRRAETKKAGSETKQRAEQKG